MEDDRYIARIRGYLADDKSLKGMSAKQFVENSLSLAGRQRGIRISIAQFTDLYNDFSNEIKKLPYDSIGSKIHLADELRNYVDSEIAGLDARLTVEAWLDDVDRRISGQPRPVHVEEREPPQILSFSVSEKSVVFDGKILVSWRTVNATSVVLRQTEGVDGKGIEFMSRVVNDSGTWSIGGLQLSCTIHLDVLQGKTLISERRIVSVAPKPPKTREQPKSTPLLIRKFQVTPTNVLSGQSVEVVWEVLGATLVRLELFEYKGGLLSTSAVAMSGTRTLENMRRPAIVKLTAINASNQETNQSAFVLIQESRTASVTAKVGIWLKSFLRQQKKWLVTAMVLLIAALCAWMYWKLQPQPGPATAMSQNTAAAPPRLPNDRETASLEYAFNRWRSQRKGRNKLDLFTSPKTGVKFLIAPDGSASTRVSMKWKRNGEVGTEVWRLRFKLSRKAWGVEQEIMDPQSTSSDFAHIDVVSPSPDIPVSVPEDRVPDSVGISNAVNRAVAAMGSAENEECSITGSLTKMAPPSGATVDARGICQRGSTGHTWGKTFELRYESHSWTVISP